MDPGRRELYVEGQRDRLFLAWTLRQSLHSGAAVREIAFVEITGPDGGGERARLLSFARWLEGKGVQIGCFADADFDRLLGRELPAGLWLTDGRDMEAYVLRRECLEKVLKLGIGSEAIEADQVLQMIREPARRLGLLRLLSEMDVLRLPFQATRLRRYVRAEPGSLVLRFDAYLSALLQNADISLARLGAVRDRLADVEAQFGDVPDAQVIHGKDAFCLIGVALSQYRLEDGEIARLLWTSFETAHVEVGSNLSAVARFLDGADGGQSVSA